MDGIKKQDIDKEDVICPHCMQKVPINFIGETEGINPLRQCANCNKVFDGLIASSIKSHIEHLAQLCWNEIIANKKAIQKMLEEISVEKQNILEMLATKVQDTAFLKGKEIFEKEIADIKEHVQNLFGITLNPENAAIMATIRREHPTTEIMIQRLSEQTMHPNGYFVISKPPDAHSPKYRKWHQLYIKPGFCIVSAPHDHAVTVINNTKLACKAKPENEPFVICIEDGYGSVAIIIFH